MTRKCQICGSKYKKIMYSQNFVENKISIIKSYDVVVCSDCGFGYADNLPSQRKFNKYYKNMSKYDVDYTNQEHNQKIFDYIRLKNKDSRILDIGCSTGGLLTLFKENGFNNIVGIDPSKKAVEKVKSKGINAICSTIDSLKLRTKFDLIILSSVLEHLVDLDKSMEKIVSYLNPRGLLFIEVPLCTRFKDNLFTPFQQFSIEHINYFSHWSLNNLIKKHKLEKLCQSNELNTVNQSVDPCLFSLSVNNEFMCLRDTATETTLKTYINKSKTKEKKLIKNIEKIFKENDKLIVWGVGTHTQMLSKYYDNSKIWCYVDSNKNYVNKQFNDKAILEISLLRKYPFIPILISSYSYQKEIEDYINHIGLYNKVIKIYES